MENIHFTLLLSGNPTNVHKSHGNNETQSQIAFETP